MVNRSICLVALLAAFSVPSLSSSEAGLGGFQGAAEIGRWNASDCVTYLGYDVDSFVLVYRQGRSSENGRGVIFARLAKDVSRRKGIGLILVDSGLYSDAEIRLLQCFYGAYSGDNGLFFQDPRLLCPRNGEVGEIYGGSPPMVQMRAFADRCKAG